jgi:transcriptional regulator with XRE-family HTH domain
MPRGSLHISGMHTDFSVFRERLAEACRIRGLTQNKLCASIGIGGRRAIDLDAVGLKALDIYRLGQIADKLGVSVDWLLGRSDVMELADEA